MKWHPSMHHSNRTSLIQL